MATKKEERMQKVLAVLKNNENGTTITQMSRILALSDVSTGGLLKEMYEKGMVARERDSKQGPILYHYIEPERPKRVPRQATEEKQPEPEPETKPETTIEQLIDALREKLGRPFVILFYEGKYPVMIDTDKGRKE